MRRALALAALAACNGHPGHPDQQVDYRVGIDEPTTSGERGSAKISEVLWSGSVDNQGRWDPTDIFIEIRNEGALPLNLSNWFLELDGTAEVSWRIPESDLVLGVGEHAFIAAKDTGCFGQPDWIIPTLAIPYGDPFLLTLRDRDERLIGSAGSRDMPPFAGGYDLAVSRSMELVQLMFGGRGTEAHMWHYYTTEPVDVPNNERIDPDCRDLTLASPGHPNSPDYSGAYSSGSFE